MSFDVDAKQRLDELMKWLSLGNTSASTWAGDIRGALHLIEHLEREHDAAYEPDAAPDWKNTPHDFPRVTRDAEPDGHCSRCGTMKHYRDSVEAYGPCWALAYDRAHQWQLAAERQATLLGRELLKLRPATDSPEKE